MALIERIGRVVQASGRVRLAYGMTITPTTEDYLQAIVALIEEGQPVIGARLAERLKVSPASVSQTVERMVRLNLLEIGEGHRIRLTASGRTAADAIVRRHRLTERFLCDVLNLGWVEAHEQAHQLEHGITDLIESRISELLGEPETCPHGGPIPGNFPEGGDAAWTPVATLAIGGSGTIRRIADVIEDDSELLSYCFHKNLRPGVPFRVAERGPEDVVLLEVEAQTVALSGHLSQHVLCESA